MQKSHTTPQHHAATHAHHATHKKSSGAGGAKIFLLAVVVILGVYFWQNNSATPDVGTDPVTGKSELSGKQMEQKVWEPVPGTKMLFGTTGECQEMFSEYFSTIDNVLFSLKEVPSPFGDTPINNKTIMDGARQVSEVDGFTEKYGYTFGPFTSGSSQGFGYSSGSHKGAFVLFTNISKTPGYQEETFLTDTGYFDAIQLSGFEEKYRPLVGRQAIPCLMKHKNGACDYEYVGMIRYPDRTMIDLECYTQASGDVYLISSVDALNLFNAKVEQDDFSKNYEAVWNKVIMRYINHIRKAKATP